MGQTCSSMIKIVTIKPFCSIHVRTEEKFIMTASRDGGLQNLEVHGMITLRITDETKGRVKVVLNQGDMKNVQLQVSK